MMLLFSYVFFRHVGVWFVTAGVAAVKKLEEISQIQTSLPLLYLVGTKPLAAARLTACATDFGEIAALCSSAPALRDHDDVHNILQ